MVKLCLTEFFHYKKTRDLGYDPFFIYILNNTHYLITVVVLQRGLVTEGASERKGVYWEAG